MDFLTANDRVGVYPDSYYAATTDLLDPLPALEGEKLADVCIVGGGYTGLSAALHCAQRGLQAVVLDAHRVGWGASGRNGGQVGAGQRLDQDELEAQLGDDYARRLFDLAREAVALVKSLVADHDIDCHLKPGVLHADHRRRYTAHSRKYVDHLQAAYGYDAARFVARDEVCEILGSEAYHSGILDREAAHLHPLRYAVGLANAARTAGASIHESSRVTAISHGPKARIETDHGSVTADHVLLACNGYLGALDKSVASRVFPINNFIIATEPLPDDLAANVMREDVAVADSKFVVNYWRMSQDRRLLFGGRENYSHRFPADIARFVRKPMDAIYPQLRGVGIEYGWGGTLAITRSRMPHFARLAPNVLTTSGYSGHGVAMATLAGELAAEAIAGQAERFDTFAAVPSRTFPGGTALRWPSLVLGMLWYSLRDRL